MLKIKRILSLISKVNNAYEDILSATLVILCEIAIIAFCLFCGAH